MPSADKNSEHLRLAAHVTASYLSNNRVNPADALELLRQVHQTLAALGGNGPLPPSLLPPPAAGSPWWRPGTAGPKRKPGPKARRSGRGQS